MTPADTMRAAVEALEAYANVYNWDADAEGIRRVWLEPDGYPRTAYNGFELARSALSLLRSALEGGEPEPVATDAVWLIHYDDADRRPEIVVGEKGARARFARISDNWNAHLFVKVVSNTRDERYRDANIQLASIPPNTPVEAGKVRVADGVMGTQGDKA